MGAAIARPGLRGWLAAWLMGLLLAFSAAPCAAPAYAAPTQPVISKPFDPCLGAATAPGGALCGQLACQTLTAPAPFASADDRLSVSPAQFHTPVAPAIGRCDAPADPPPRPPMN